MSEFIRMIDAARLPEGVIEITASEKECAALAARFALVALHTLDAKVVLVRDGAKIAASGTLRAEIVQSCRVSGDDLPARIEEPLALRFVPPSSMPDRGEIEIELSAADLDEIEMEEAGRFDLGEALAQTLALAIDPYAEGPGAEQARQRSGILSEGENGAFGALKGLFKT